MNISDISLYDESGFIPNIQINVINPYRFVS